MGAVSMLTRYHLCGIYVTLLLETWDHPVNGLLTTPSRFLSPLLVTKNSRKFVPFSTATSEASYTSIDPLIISVIEERTSSSLGTGLNLIDTSNGIRTWKSCLGKGRFPINADFNNDVWPAEPFFSKVVLAMAELELPRFIMRHPETLSLVLLTLLRLTFKFMEEVQIKEEELKDDTSNIYDTEFDDETDLYGNNALAQILHQDDNLILKESIDDLFSLSIDDIAKDISAAFVQEWSGVVSGVSFLDQLFGYDHGVLDVQENGDDENGNSDGFGLEDGIWQHTGWREIPALQKQIASIPELKHLMRDIGRRPTAENSDEIHKFAPRKLHNDGSLGAQYDPQIKESVKGITLSGSLTEMLPSEAVLLRGKSGVLRRLFMAKKSESKLLSYEMSGWEDVPSVPLTKPLYFQRMPSAPGGPIVICLDTSWSMSGMREQLSKAVVLACVSTAHKQRRDCQIVAFSSERGVIEAGVITPDSLGIKRLLDFLTHSFGGGTDVTGCLKFAIETLDSDVMGSADLLMISDGEIPDPPVSTEIMETIDYLKLRNGVKFHGLLIGKRESKPLSKVCSETHNFLMNYDTMIVPEVKHEGLRVRKPSALLMNSRFDARGRFGFVRPKRDRLGGFMLRAKYEEDGYGDSGRVRKNKRKRKKKWTDEEEYENDDDFIVQQNWGNEETNSNFDIGEAQTPIQTYSSIVEESVDALKSTVGNSLAANAWNPTELREERNTDGSCWNYRKNLNDAVSTVSAGLIERQEEARLVVLAMLSMEHILLLGVPGTGKSILGRRLSKLCDGAFFQRLLTKFTTPEELFGPLSLKSLENDEYRRCTAGFLPTASVAFLDEIFKANSAILNTLLTILNERKFDNAGGQEACPIRCVVGASNEIPESDELVPLFDRFLLRKEVLPVSDEGILHLLSMSNPQNLSGESDEIGDMNLVSEHFDSLISILSNAADSVHIRRNECELIRDLRTFMREEHGVEISDRRVVKAGRLLKISAVTEGRNSVDVIDLLLLSNIFWIFPEQKKIVEDWLLDNIIPNMGAIESYRLLLDTLRSESLESLRKTSGDVTGKLGMNEYIKKISYLRRELSRIIDLLKDLSDISRRNIELLSHADDFLWLDPDNARSAQQILLPRAEKFSTEVMAMLVDATCFELCLSDTSDIAPEDEMRSSVLENLWADGITPDITFTPEEFAMGMKEAKQKYDLETFRKWKRERKRNKK